MFLWHLKSSIAVAVGLLLVPLSAHAVIDEWQGLCYKAAGIGQAKKEELGSCKAYEGVSGHSRLLRGILLQDGTGMHGWSDANSSSFQVNGKPGVFQRERVGGYPPFSIRRDGFCIGIEGKTTLICFDPATEIKR